jgi:apolipoprotein D and lipocalin family protein
VQAVAMRIRFEIILCLLMASVAVFGQSKQSAVPQVDLARYTGNWFEIARTQNYWQKQCASDVTARYDLQPGGKFIIHNACRKANGSETTGDGVAVGSDTNGAMVNGKLRVSFFRPFYFDYWVIALDTNYGWAVVVEPKRRNLWILSRTPSLGRETRALIERDISAAGFDPKTLVDTPQSAAHTGTQMAASR